MVIKSPVAVLLMPKGQQLDWQRPYQLPGQRYALLQAQIQLPLKYEIGMSQNPSVSKIVNQNNIFNKMAKQFSYIHNSII